jgi:hypothetical protein
MLGQTVLQVYRGSNYDEFVPIQGRESFLLDPGLGKERPERPIGVPYFEVKVIRVTLSYPLLNLTPYENASGNEGNP